MQTDLHNNDPQNTGQEDAALVVAQPDCRRYPLSINGQMVHSAEEEQQLYRQQEERRAAYRQAMREQWLATPQGRLCLEFYQKFQEYKEYLEKNPLARRRADGAEVNFTEHELFKEGLRLMGEMERERAEKDRRNLRQAHLAARCEHRHADGRRCGSPRVRGKELCHWHERMEEARALKLDLGPMEDPDSILVAIMKLQRAVIDGALDYRQTGQLAYLIQLAAWNVTRTKRTKPLEEEAEAEYQ